MPFGLTPRQAQVGALLHLQDKEIAQVVGLSRSTVRKRIKQVFKRTGGTTRTHAALILAGLQPVSFLPPIALIN